MSYVQVNTRWSCCMTITMSPEVHSLLRRGTQLMLSLATSARDNWESQHISKVISTCSRTKHHVHVHVHVHTYTYMYAQCTCTCIICTRVANDAKSGVKHVCYIDMHLVRQAHSVFTHARVLLLQLTPVERALATWKSTSPLLEKTCRTLWCQRAVAAMQ